MKIKVTLAVQCNNWLWLEGEKLAQWYWTSLLVTCFIEHILSAKSTAALFKTQSEMSDLCCWPWTLIIENVERRIFSTLNFQLYVILGDQYIET